MVTAVIILDFVPLFLFFFLYSALEIFIATTMEDFRYNRSIQIDEDEELEDDEFDDDDRERHEHIALHTDIFNTGGGLENDDDDFDDYEEENEDDYEEEEEEEELFPVVRMLHTDSIEEDEEDDDYEDEEEDYGEEDEDDDEDNYEEEEEEEEELFPVEMTSSRVSSFRGGSLQGGMVNVINNNSVVENSNGSEEPCEGKPVNQEKKCGGELNGSFCPICFEAWTSGGEHQICCLPCGHIYGLSCIEKWLQQSRSSGKCPQCNNICTIKDVRVLYASRLCVADEELQKRVRSLEARCAYLEQKVGPLTPDELIDQICSNPAAVQRLATVLSGLYQQPVSP